MATGAPALFVVGAILLGAGYGPVTPASSHILARSTPPQRLSLVFSLKQTGVPLGGALAGAVVARVGWGVIADRWGRPMRLLGLVAIAMGAAAVATGQFTPQWPLAAVALACAAFGATAIGWNGVYLAQVARLAPPGKAGDATGGSLVFTYAGVLFGPPAFTLLVGGGVSYASAYVMLAMPAVACGLWLFWRDWNRSGPGRDTPGKLENG